MVVPGEPRWWKKSVDPLYREYYRQLSLGMTKNA
jgi:hypothetical protein